MKRFSEFMTEGDDPVGTLRKIIHSWFHKWRDFNQSQFLFIKKYFPEAIYKGTAYRGLEQWENLLPMSWWHDKQVGMSMDDLYAGGDEGKYEGLNLNLMRQNIAKQDRGSLVSWAKTKRGIEVFNGESYWMRGGENPVEFIVITAEVNGIDLTAITKHLESDLHIKQINNTEEIVALLPSDFKIFGFYDPMSDKEWFRPNGKPM